MPTTTALAAFNDFEFIVDDRANYPEIVFDGIVDSFVTVPFGSPGGSLAFGPVNTVALIQDDVDGSIISGGSGFVAMLITPDATVTAADANDRIGLFGPNTHLILNAGTIVSDIAFGQGQDAMYNFGLLLGDVRMGAGDDFFINDSVSIGPYDLYGATFGHVFMGSGDDTVLNGGQLGLVSLGDGNDFYSAITPQALVDNYDNPLVSADQIRAGNGDDTVYGGANDDIIRGQNGNDLLNGHNGDDSIWGGNNRDSLNGGNGEDRLDGGAGSDILFGGNDDDVLIGGTGRDRIVGGRGDDKLLGGSGADTFFFAARSGEDTIADFKDGDLIRLPQVFRFDTDAGSFQPVIGFDEIDAFTTYSNGSAFIDLDGLYRSVDLDRFAGGGGENSITLRNVGNDGLTADDFIL